MQSPAGELQGAVVVCKALQDCAGQCSALQKSCKALQRRYVRRSAAAAEASRLAERERLRLQTLLHDSGYGGSGTLGLVLLA